MSKRNWTEKALESSRANLRKGAMLTMPVRINDRIYPSIESARQTVQPPVAARTFTTWLDGQVSRDYLKTKFGIARLERAIPKRNYTRKKSK